MNTLLWIYVSMWACEVRQGSDDVCQRRGWPILFGFSVSMFSCSLYPFSSYFFSLFLSVVITPAVGLHKEADVSWVLLFRSHTVCRRVRLFRKVGLPLWVSKWARIKVKEISATIYGILTEWAGTRCKTMHHNRQYNFFLKKSHHCVQFGFLIQSARSLSERMRIYTRSP